MQGCPEVRLAESVDELHLVRGEEPGQLRRARRLSLRREAAVTLVLVR